MNFVDTNVLVYFGDAGSAKSERAAKIVRAGGIVSVQVLNEFANVARTKNRLPWETIGQSLDLVKTLFEVRALILATHEAAIALAQRHGLNIYDALIVASALEAGCDTLYTEDMQHDLVVEGQLRLVNPFA
ncbi:MAG: PIN domain-containing protein [Devosia sp.]